MNKNFEKDYFFKSCLKEKTDKNKFMRKAETSCLFSHCEIKIKKIFKSILLKPEIKLLAD